jgi:hypothetical protein
VTRPLLRPALLPLVGALALLPAAAAADPPWRKPPKVEPRILPDPEGLEPPFVAVGDAVELSARGLSIRIEGLSEAERGAFFELRTDLARDPLPARAAFPEGFTVFELSFRNLSGRPFRFQPALTACRWTSDNELLPVHLDMVFEMLRALHHGAADADQRSVEDLKHFHVEPLELKHGQSATRLLIYEGHPGKAKKLTLELGPLFLGSESFSPAVDFLLVYPDKN